MPLSYSLNDNYLLVNISDCCFTRKDVINCLIKAANDRFFEKGIPVLIDISGGCEIILPFHAVKSIIEFLAEQSGYLHSRFVFVEKNLSPFRLGRIFSALASDYGFQCRSFHKYEDAKEWLLNHLHDVL